MQPKSLMFILVFTATHRTINGMQSYQVHSKACAINVAKNSHQAEKAIGLAGGGKSLSKKAS